MGRCKGVRAVGLFALGLFLARCGDASSDFGCETPGCRFTKVEWSRLQSLANLPDPPPDPSNRYVGDPKAIALGHKLYFDASFSGTATQLDMLRRPTQYARAPKGQAIGISCATCHNPARAGSDFTSLPGHVSVGAGWYDVNGQQTVNAAYYDVFYWNGRNDSLWAQVLAVTESFVSMNGNRVEVAWRLHDAYKAEYDALFPEYPLPMTESRSELIARLDTTGQCKLVDDGAGNPICPSSCREETNLATGAVGCWPRIPASGKPGTTKGCQRGDSKEPFGDAYDCMAAEDQTAITRAYVNFAKAISAYEYTLISRNAPFDRFVNEGPLSGHLSESAQRGAKLFVGKASCIDCHDTPFFSDNGFHNIGVPQVGAAVPTEADCPAGSSCNCTAGTNCLPWGGFDGLKKLKGNGFRRDSKWSDDANDASRAAYYDVELTDALKGTWRTPSLRDVELTAPYMHNGLYRTLEEVVWHYNQGGSHTGFPGEKAPQLRPLFLSDAEQEDLIAFLKTLTGEALPASVVSPPSP